MVAEKRESYNPLLKSYPDSIKVNSVSIGAETLFTRLIAQSDDASHYYADPSIVLAKLFTHRMVNGSVSMKNVKKWIAELAKVDLIRVYCAGDGKKYLEIVNSKKSQRRDLKQDIRFPYNIRHEFETNSTRLRYGLDESTVTSNETKLNKTKQHPADADDVRGKDKLPPGLARWWAAWPRHHRKQGRSKCESFWMKHKLEPQTENILAVLHRCKASDDWQKQGGAFVPFPMTWLNRTPWETDAADMPIGTAHDDENGEWKANPPTEEQLKLLAELNGK